MTAAQKPTTALGEVRSRLTDAASMLRTCDRMGRTTGSDAEVAVIRREAALLLRGAAFDLSILAQGLLATAKA